jgi:hypothetical protein
MADATSKLYTVEEVRERLKRAVEKAGKQSAFADGACVSQNLVSMVLSGKKPPRHRILKALGLRKVTMYEDIPNP